MAMKEAPNTSMNTKMPLYVLTALVCFSIDASAAASKTHSTETRNTRSRKVRQRPVSEFMSVILTTIKLNSKAHGSLSVHATKVWQQWYKKGDPTCDSNSCKMLDLTVLNS
mmetsp:Transcript_139718/g.354316  ORF Transcript_139718/g.354316 Transcript_139718/m.354316 type:complete len:111 (+) Transcript_139718:227-559(+)